ncbi:uncharacterized protein LOC113350966 [Papaver somniferum]|uniref:uncharacterized protein LOC113350966 n=1 Tax=Papaver somniferum TaxID=3469 RepID=UPI000E6F9E19|nr:uncharacterized protein LOC113350966 [Papaver somniferum]
MSPPRNWLKINTDGAWDPNSEIGGMGFLIRDSSDLFIYAESKNLICFLTEEVEIYGIREALRAAKRLKMDRIIIEGDAAEVIEKIKRENFLGDQRTYYLYQDIRVLIPSFQSILFNFANRTCSGDAHELPQWDKKNVNQMAWSMPPGWLIPALCGDFRRELPSGL